MASKRKGWGNPKGTPVKVALTPHSAVSEKPPRYPKSVFNRPRGR